ncbi:hypothetical protein WN944_023294 [Citrus x changshan-huyou]|uniref:Uncharacterized protein n=1 Tax=Citrus x changshan-huyou TaxID=2935761 RepID=A0AAP0N036_9ROSI
MSFHFYDFIIGLPSVKSTESSCILSIIRSGQIQTQGSQGSETLQITACYRCFICLVHIDVLCSSYQFDESVDEEVCGSSLWCLYIAWMVM